MIRKKYISSVASILTIQWVCFQGATKSFGLFGREEDLHRNAKTDGSMLKKVTKAWKLMQP